MYGMGRRLVEAVAVGVGLGRRSSSRSSSAAPIVRRWRRANTSVSNRNREWMSTTTWFVPCRSTSSRASRSSPVRRRQPGLDDERLAEDAGGLGERHRQLALQRRPAGERGVVVGVAEFVGGGLGRVERIPTSSAARATDRRRTACRTRRPTCRRAAPASIHCSSRARSTRPPSVGLNVANASRTTSMPSSHEIWPAANGSGATRSHHGSRSASWPWRPAFSLHPPAEVGQRRDDRRLHRVERRPADAVGEQRRVERRRPAAATVDARWPRP